MKIVIFLQLTDLVWFFTENFVKSKIEEHEKLYNFRYLQFFDTVPLTSTSMEMFGRNYVNLLKT